MRSLASLILVGAIAANDCDRAVTQSLSWATNAECSSLCQKSGPLADEFVSKCKLAHYSVLDGRTVPDESCFDQWIFGYADPTAGLTYITEKTETPAQCQALCQKHDDCVRWQWGADSLPDADPENPGLQICNLKNREQVSQAGNIDVSSGEMLDVSLSPYCNVNTPYTCTTPGMYNCIPCHGHMACIWESHMHVTGGRDCTAREQCEGKISGGGDKPSGAPETTTTTTLQPRPTRPTRTAEPTPKPTQQPTPEPTQEITPEPTPEPTEEPTPKPTHKPTHARTTKAEDTPADGDECDSGCNDNCGGCDDEPCRPCRHYHRHHRHCRGSY